MSDKHFRLSVEEVAYSMSLLGDPTSARGMLSALLGDMQKEELEGHLYAATHSLMARGLLKLDLEQRTQQLNDGLAGLVRTLLRHDSSLQCSKASQSAGLGMPLAFYFAADRIVKHAITSGVISDVATVADTAEVVKDCAAFFDLPWPSAHAGQSGRGPESVGSIPSTLLDDAATPDASAARLSEQLLALGIASDVASDLAADLGKFDFRGSVIRLDTDPDGSLSGRGLLLLKSASRLWVLQAPPGESARLNVYAGGPDVFSAMVNELLNFAGEPYVPPPPPI